MATHASCTLVIRATTIAALHTPQVAVWRDVGGGLLPTDDGHRGTQLYHACQNCIVYVGQHVAQRLDGHIYCILLSNWGRCGGVGRCVRAVGVPCLSPREHLGLDYPSANLLAPTCETQSKAMMGILIASPRCLYSPHRGCTTCSCGTCTRPGSTCTRASGPS